MHETAQDSRFAADPLQLRARLGELHADRLHVADEATALWQKTEEELEEVGLPPPFWAFAWAGGQALARFLLDHPDRVAGARVLVGHCYDRTETPPYGPWIELFGRYRHADGMPPLARASSFMARLDAGHTVALDDPMANEPLHRFGWGIDGDLPATQATADGGPHDAVPPAPAPPSQP